LICQWNRRETFYHGQKPVFVGIKEEVKPGKGHKGCEKRIPGEKEIHQKGPKQGETLGMKKRADHTNIREEA